LNEAVQVAYGISPKSKNIKEAVNVAMWMAFTADGIKAMRFGFPGKHFTIDSNGVAKATPKAEAGGMTLDPNGLLKEFVDFEDMNIGCKLPGHELFSVYNKTVVREISKHSGPKYVVPAGKSAIYDRVGPSLIKKRQ
jgi:hypothetical protein